MSDIKAHFNSQIKEGCRKLKKTCTYCCINYVIIIHSYPQWSQRRRSEFILIFSLHYFCPRHLPLFSTIRKLTFSQITYSAVLDIRTRKCNVPVWRWLLWLKPARVVYTATVYKTTKWPFFEAAMFCYEWTGHSVNSNPTCNKNDDTWKITLYLQWQKRARMPSFRTESSDMQIWANRRSRNENNIHLNICKFLIFLSFLLFFFLFFFLSFPNSFRGLWISLLLFENAFIVHGRSAIIGLIIGLDKFWS